MVSFAVVAALLAGCSSSSSPEPTRPGLLDRGWIVEIVRDPTAFRAAVDAPDANGGWPILHRNDWLGALQAGGPPALRAATELARLHHVLAELQDDAWVSLGTKYLAIGGPAADSAFPAFVWAAASDAENTEAIHTWQSRAAKTPGLLTPDWTAPLAPPATATGPLADRARAHAAARSGTGDLDSLRLAAAQPVVTEHAANAERALWDPWIHDTLSVAYTAKATAAPAGLGATLFSDHLAGSEMKVDETLTALGLAVPGGADEAEACRELVRGLDARLDPWLLQLGNSVNDDGRALLHDLSLVPATRARVLTTLAVEALDSARPTCALAYAEMARDHEQGRAITAVNSPTLYATLAAANLRTGHTREALDALSVLTTAFPEVQALTETVGDLAVLEGIHRSGDSREN